MSAGCYLCELSYGTIPGEQTGDAVGGCKLCGVLACRGHAYRDPNVPRFVCGVCLPNLLAVASKKMTGAGGGSPKSLGPRTPEGNTPSGTTTFEDLSGDINTVEDVISDFGSDRWKAVRDDAIYLSSLLTRSEAEIFRPFARGMAARAAVLMATAIALATHLRLPAEEMIPELRDAVQVARQYV